MSTRSRIARAARPTRLVGGIGAAVLITLGVVPVSADTPVAEVSELRLYSSFWQNLHHHLYVSAWAHRPPSAGRRDQAMPLPAEPAVELSREEQSTWDAAVAFYDRHLASQDLLFDPQLTGIKLALAEADDGLSGGGVGDDLRATLLAAAPVYRKHWWPEHDRANRAWIAGVRRDMTVVAPAIRQRLTRLYAVEWFTAPVRVDVVRVGKSGGAYTSINPRTHIVLASGDRDYDGWAGTEMLFHEASHALIGGVRRAIDTAAASAGREPRDLWHVVLFYVAGELTRQVLAERGIDYRPYLYATGLFDRAWPQWRTPMERYGRAFVDEKSTLEETVASLAATLP